MANRSTGFIMCILSILIAASFSAQKSFAWGKEGHEAVAMIADQNLTSEAKAQLSKILQGVTLEDAATWPDRIKHTGPWQHTSPYHFADMLDSQNYLTMIESLPAEKRGTGDVVRALVKAEDVLRDSRSTKDQQRNALSFLVHFVGDLHQPLHQGRPDDRGGNEITAVYFGKQTNLHAIWDTLLIENFMKTPSPDAGAPADPDSYDLTKKQPATDDTAAYVAALRTPSAKEITQWQNSYLLDWSADSVEIRAKIYSGWTGSNSAGYQGKFADYANEKILRAGYRLAAWLNAIAVGDGFQTDKAADLRQHLAQVFGPNYDDAINLDQADGKTPSLSPAELSAFDCDDD
jgi:S1/P1 Nuclease